MIEERLNEFLGLLESADPTSSESFCKVLKASELALGMSDTDLADDLEISRPTINRWRTGKNAPQLLMRRIVFDRLKKRAKSLLRKNKAEPIKSSSNSGQGTPPAPVAASGRR